MAIKQQKDKTTAKGHGVNKRSAFTDHNKSTFKNHTHGRKTHNHTRTRVTTIRSKAYGQQHQTTQQLLGIGVNIRSAFTDCNAEARLALKRHGVNIRSAFTDHDKKTYKHIAVKPRKDNTTAWGQQGQPSPNITATHQKTT